jgi:hypothetical protein
MEKTTTPRIALIKILAIVGFCAGLGFIVWGLISLLPAAGKGWVYLANLSETINSYRPGSTSLSEEQTLVVNATTPFQFSVKPSRRVGTYSLEYSCQLGVGIDVVTDTGRTPLPCTLPLDLGDGTTPIELAISTNESGLVDVPLTLTFTPAERGRVRQETVTIAVVGSTPPTTAATPTVAGAESPAIATPPPEPAVVSEPDLVVFGAVLGSALGTEFVPNDRFQTGDRAGVRFRVENRGAAASASWTFVATLPDGTVYEAPTQAGLTPESGIEFTLGFPLLSTAPGTSEVTLSLRTGSDADPDNNLLRVPVPLVPAL